jgi:hypothetical protein
MVIDRWYTDVVPERPDIVLVALSLGNENIIGSSEKEIVYNTYRKNMLRIIRMIRN